MKVKQDATGQELDIPDAAVGDFAAKGGYSFPAGTQIPVKHDDGTVSTVPVEQFWQQRQLYMPATQSDVQAHIVEQQKLAADAEDARLDEEYGQGLTNMLQAGAEGAARALTLGASDWALKQAGVDAQGIREREKRNPISATVGEAVGMVAPAILTGGTSTIEQVGLKGALATAARATPASLVSHIGEAVGAKVAASMGEGFAARLAAGTARVAAEGAIYGAAGDLSARAFDGKDLLSDDAMQEYLHAAGYGAAMGGALGGGGVILGAGLSAGFKLAGRGLDASKRIVQQSVDAMNAPVREAEAELATAKAADFDGEARALQQKYDGLKVEDFSAQENAVAAAKAKVEASAPKTEVAPGAMGQSANVPIEQVTQMVQADAERLGVAPRDAKTAMDRVKAGHEMFGRIDEEHELATRKIAAIGDEFSEAVGKADDLLDTGVRVDTIGREMAVDPTAPPHDQIVTAMREQHARMREVVSQYLEDADGQIKSTARGLDRYLAQQEKDLAALGPKDSAAAYAIMDQSQRVSGRVRDFLGKRTRRLGIGTLSRALDGVYEDNRQFLTNPAIVGDRAAELTKNAKGAWSTALDVSEGYGDALLASDSGGARDLSGFGTYDRFDPAKTHSLLKDINSAKSQLKLELVSRHIDATIGRMEHYLADMKPTGEARLQCERAIAKAKELADEIVSYRSKDQLAREYAALTAPAVKELEASSEKLAAMKEKAALKLEREQAKIAAKIEAAQSKAGSAREKAIAKAEAQLAKAQEAAGGGIAGSMLDGALTLGGMALMGPAGAIVGHGMVNTVKYMAGPVLKAVAKGSLQSALKTGETLGKFRAAMAVGKRLEKAINSIDDSLRAANPAAVAGKLMAIRYAEGLPAAYDKAREETLKHAQTDPRASYLMSVLPPESVRLQLRPDLGVGPTTPAIAQRAFMRAYRGAMDPVGTVERAAKGAASREEINATRAIYPKMIQRVYDSVLHKSQKLNTKPSMRSQRLLSKLWGSALHFTDQPDFVRFAQAAYQGGDTAQPSAQSGAGSGNARQMAAKGATAMASPSQRLENGLG